MKHINRLQNAKSLSAYLKIFIVMMLGCALAAFAIECFFVPNNLIDGGIVGISMIGAHIFGRSYLPFLFLVLNLPFIYLAFKAIGKTLVIQMFGAVLFFVACLLLFHHFVAFAFSGDTLEVIVFSGALLGAGVGFIIRAGGCLDGTEIMAIILNRRKGFTVGQVIMFFNVFIFVAAGFVYGAWTPALRSLLTYFVAFKVMDAVIVGLDESKSMIIISTESKKISNVLTRGYKLGLTIFYGRGGFSTKDREIIYLVIDRIQIAEIKDLVYDIDPKAFIAIENIHEVLNGRRTILKKRKKLWKKMI